MTVACLFHRVGEEREKAREELEKERRDYEQQILKLVEQQEQILKERQGNVPLRRLTVRLISRFVAYRRVQHSWPDVLV